jgi:hypothetical protein
MNAAEREELDWLAFLYVAGELAPDEHDEFERRLANDQLACDAVSRAVKVTQAIRTAEEVKPVAVSPVRRARLRRSLHLAACLSACALVVIVCHWLLRDSESTLTDVSEAPSTAQAELAVVWRETRLEVADQQSDVWTLPQVNDSGDSPTAPGGPSHLEVPDWLLSAVALEADRKSREGEDG